MTKRLKNQEGVTLVEVVIAIGILVIIFAMFGSIFASAFKNTAYLDENKRSREVRVGTMERNVGANTVPGKVDGTVDLTLDFSHININSSSYGAIGNANEKVSVNIYRSGEYGSPEAKDKYVYAFKQ